MTRVVFLAGRRGSGKSTAAKYLRQQANFRTVKFAGPLKDMLRAGLRHVSVTDDVIESMLEDEPMELKEVPSQEFQRWRGREREIAEVMVTSMIRAFDPAHPVLGNGHGPNLTRMPERYQPLEALAGKSPEYAVVSLQAFILSWTQIPEITPRKVMQELGTEWGRQWISETVWVDIWTAMANRYAYVLVDDTRFPNELSIGTERFPDSTSIRLTRPGNPKGAQPHPSEALIDTLPVKHDITNLEGRSMEMLMAVHKAAMS